MSHATYRFAVGILGSVLLLGGCTLKEQETPSLTGPSGLGTSLVLTVSPDVLTQDGASQSLVQITALDSNGQPLRNVSMRVEIRVDGFTTDFGRLSARSVVTDANGRASVTYTAPAPVQGISSEVPIQIAVTPSESDFANATVRLVTIRVVPGGILSPPTSPFRPDFTPPAATVGNPAVFTATVGGADTVAQVTSIQWDFGDGSTAVGSTVQHTFSRTGTFLVTVALTDTLGRSASTAKSVTVGQGTVPTASFFASPASPNVGQTINFNATGSAAEPGHSIATYSWDFGDGTTVNTGSLTTHIYTRAGTYTVALKVTDDAGRKSTLTTQTITVTPPNPKAVINLSPPTGAPGQTITFLGNRSTPAAGRTIVNYTWNFGDGSAVVSGPNSTVAHSYGRAGTFTITLLVTDDQGNQDLATAQITIQ